MKILKAVLILIFFIVFLSSCASSRHVNTLNTSETLLSKENNDVKVLREVVYEKIEKIDNFADLHNLDNFLSHQQRIKSTGKKLIITSVNDSDFPFFLEKVFVSNAKLDGLSRVKANLVTIPSTKMPGVINLFVKVSAEEIGEKWDIFDWIPPEETWQKFVDAKANNIIEREVGNVSFVKQQFLSLFYYGNLDYNLELLAPVIASGGAWTEMPHPKDTEPKAMLIPIATTNEAMLTYIK